MSTENTVSRVMVVGGGVAGVNAALELAERGYPVSLVEKAATLGGTVTRLHRLYPVCSCCKLSDRVAAALQHPGIEVLTESAIAQVSGSAGDFTVSLTVKGAPQQVRAGALVLAMGIEPFDPTGVGTYAYSEFPNVVTSIEFEWLQKPAGSTAGRVQRPSDGAAPKKIAWLQCVGSRDINACDASYCSNVCCMYALKEATHLLEKAPGTQADFFYMDLRAHGKGYEEYANKAKALGVNFIRSRVHSVEKVAGTEDLLLRYMASDGQTSVQEETYDMVVLSVGLRPSAEQAAVAEKLGVKLTDDRFVQTTALNPVETSVPGVFVCGGGTGPEDVHGAVVQAIASVGKVGAVVSAPKAARTFPPLRDLSAEAARIGVVFALCPTKGAEVSAMAEAAGRFAASLPGVATVKNLALAQSNPFSDLTGLLKAEKLNRLVFASCSPEIHKEAVETALREAGLNPYVYDLIDLRTMGADSAPQVQEMLRLATLRLSLLDPPNVTAVDVVKRALVVGGGLTGMESALTLAKQGIPVTLVEKSGQLGGQARHVKSTWQGDSVQDYLGSLVRNVTSQDGLTVLTGAEVVETRGFQGNFLTTVRQGGSTQQVSHGATILATGGQAYKPTEYLYGQNPNVYTWAELTEKLIADPAPIVKAKTAVFIQCVGSREPSHSYCSRLCCTYAARTALDLKAQNPDMDIYVLYRDMRTFGEREDLYGDARRKGIFFIRYDVDQKPAVTQSGSKLLVTIKDPILQRDVQIPADFISLQTAITPTDNSALGQLFQVSLDGDGFFTESPSKMKPVDSEIAGVFVAGLALAPKAVEDSLAEAQAAAGRAMTVLSKDQILVGGAVATVDPKLCAACLVCVRTCPFGIPVVKPNEDAAFRGAATIDPGQCQGCGMCVSDCPAKAISMTLPSDKQLVATAEAILKAS